MGSKEMRRKEPGIDDDAACSLARSFTHSRARTSVRSRAFSMNELVNLEFQNSSHRLILFIIRSVSSAAAAAVVELMVALLLR